jgi:drug/metabolite transporter (DMT)-like permease
MRILPVALAGMLLSSAAAQAQSTEEKFQDLFITAGYCTAFGAAVGTAFLAWTEDPTANLRYVAMGASLGFLGGSVLGSYIIFAPGLTDNSQPGEPGGSLLARQASLPRQGLVVNPVYNVDTKRLASVAGGMTLLSF